MKLLLLILLTVIAITIKAQTYYIVRHAEKAAVPPGSAMSATNPPLSKQGEERAEALKNFLKSKKIQYIFSTNTLRTIATARPVSAATGKKIKLYAKNGQTFIDSLKLLRYNTLIVGHSNTIDDITNALSSGDNVHGDIPDNEFDNLYIVTIKGEKISFKAAKYGAAAN